MKFPKTSKFWTLGIVILAVALSIPALLSWASSRAIDGMFANDEATTRLTELPMLDGAVTLGLYRQHMWDALLWTVIATPDPLPRTIAAHNAELDSAFTRLVVTDHAQLDFQEPPQRLERQSRTDATLCGKERCQIIRCADATRTCQRIDQ